MDSQWFDQAATKMNGRDYTNAGNKIDLNLKLGLPNSSDHDDLDFDHMTTNHPNLDIDALYSHDQGMNHYKMVNGQGMNMANIGQSFNPNEIIAWPPSSNLMGSQSQYSHGNAEAQAQYKPLPSSNDNYSFIISPSPPLHIHYPRNNNNNNFNIIINPIHNLQLAASSAAGGGGRGMRRPRRGTFIDPCKRCTNYNCNTNDTPMWRRGPLGPKTLCNACGIKYRKEEEKRMKAEEEADKSSNQNPNIETA